MTTRSDALSGDSGLDYLMLATALTRFARAPAELDERELDTVCAEARRQYALQQRILAAPAAAEVVVPAPVVAEAVATLEHRYPDPQAFEEDLARNHLDRARLTRAVARELTVTAAMERLCPGTAQVGDEELEIYYLQHRERFDAPESRVASHILITVNADYAENARRVARRRCEKLVAEVAEDPQRFAELALRHSECPTAMHGGTIGRVARGKLYPELDAVLFALEEGAVSGPIESPLGFHLLRCERVVPAGPLPFDLVRERIAPLVAERKRRACLRAHLAG